MPLFRFYVRKEVIAESLKDALKQERKGRIFSIEEATEPVSNDALGYKLQDKRDKT